MSTEHDKEKPKLPTKHTLKSIKVEGRYLHPLSHYIEDRVELIRQIFMTLSSVTIKSLAPDFLQVKKFLDISVFRIYLKIMINSESKFGNYSRVLFG